MNSEKVRCWRVGPKGELFITYPEGSMGHDLICCNSCGDVYAVNIAKQLYIEPNLNQQLAGVRCLRCRNLLAGNWSQYPENYVGKDGQLCQFERSPEIPNQGDSLIKEFFEVFSS